jgi:hypothetical protein
MREHTVMVSHSSACISWGISFCRKNLTARPFESWNIGWKRCGWVRGTGKGGREIPLVLSPEFKVEVGRKAD